MDTVPPPTGFFVHVLRPAPGTAGPVSTILGQLFQDPAERETAALLSPDSSVKGGVYSATVTVPRSGALRIRRDGQPPSETIALIERLTKVGSELPAALGVEGVLSPLRGFRLSLHGCVPRGLVLYAKTAADRELWSDYFRSLVPDPDPADAAPSRGLFPPSVEAPASPSLSPPREPDVRSPVRDRASSFFALSPSDIRGRGHSIMAEHVDPLQDRMRDSFSRPAQADSPSPLQRPPLSPLSHIPMMVSETFSPLRPQSAPSLEDVLSRLYPPLRLRRHLQLVEGDVTAEHKHWAFGADLPGELVDERFDDLAFMHRLNHAPCTGRWCEVAQRDPAQWPPPPLAPEPPTQSPTAATALSDAELLDDYGRVGGASPYDEHPPPAPAIGRVPTAKERFGEMQSDPRHAAKDEERIAALRASAARDPFPWIDLDWSLPPPVLRVVLGRLAALRLHEDGVPVPPGPPGLVDTVLDERPVGLSALLSSGAPLFPEHRSVSSGSVPEAATVGLSCREEFVAAAQAMRARTTALRARILQTLPS